MVAGELLSQPVTALKGVGSKVADRLAKIGIRQVQDLLFHLPLRYQDRTRLMPLGALRPGQEVLVEGTIQLAQIKFGRRRSLLCHVSDGTGAIVLRFFHFSKAQQEQLAKGRRIRCFAEVRNGVSSLEMVHPEYQLLAGEGVVPVDSELTPVYPTTEGLHQLSLRKLIQQALAILDQDSMPELLTEASRLHQAASYSLVEALKYVHQPPPDAAVEQLLERRHPAQKRLAYEELLAQQLTMKKLRARGIHLAMDDFGTGYSSLAYLKQFPLNTLKIDKAFIDDMRTARGRNMVDTIMTIAHNLSLNVVAEGVETQEQLEYLKSLNCDYAQGYIISRALPASEVLTLIRHANLHTLTQSSTSLH